MKREQLRKQIHPIREETDQLSDLITQFERKKPLEPQDKFAFVAQVQRRDKQKKSTEIEIKL